MDNSEFVKVIDQLQVKKYIKHGAKLYDVFYDDGTDRLVYVFGKEETYPLFQKWIRRLLD